MIGTATVGGAALRAHPPALDVRARRPEPRRPQGHDRGQGRHAASGSSRRPTSSGSRSTGPTRRAPRPPTSRPGCLPQRARGLDRRLPTLGTGDYEWRGFLRQREHPHDVGGPGDLLLNWNNQSAPGFMHGDDAPFGSAHRVELFDQWPRHPTLADTVSVMNRAATEDVRSPVWPVVSRVLRSGAAPSALADRSRRRARRLGAPRRAAPRRRPRRRLRRRRPGDHGRALAARSPTR